MSRHARHESSELEVDTNNDSSVPAHTNVPPLTVSALVLKTAADASPQFAMTTTSPTEATLTGTLTTANVSGAAADEDHFSVEDDSPEIEAGFDGEATEPESLLSSFTTDRSDGEAGDGDDEEDEDDINVRCQIFPGEDTPDGIYPPRTAPYKGRPSNRSVAASDSVPPGAEPASLASISKQVSRAAFERGLLRHIQGVR